MGRRQRGGSQLSQKQEELVLKFGVAYSNAIRRSFEVFGSQVSEIMVHFFGRKYDVHVLETLEKPERLAEALERTLGTGAILIEEQIVRELHSELSVSPSKSSIGIKNAQDFVACIGEVRKQLEAAG
jgi:hypothetical protein